MKLAIAQMVLGALILVNWLSLSLGIAWWRVPTWPDHDLLEGVWRVLTVPWFTVFLVLGLVVLGCGIAQFVKAQGLKAVARGDSVDRSPFKKFSSLSPSKEN